MAFPMASCVARRSGSAQPPPERPQSTQSSRYLQTLQIGSITPGFRSILCGEGFTPRRPSSAASHSFCFFAHSCRRVVVATVRSITASSHVDRRMHLIQRTLGRLHLRDHRTSGPSGAAGARSLSSSPASLLHLAEFRLQPLDLSGQALLDGPAQQRPRMGSRPVANSVKLLHKKSNGLADTGE